VPHLQEWLPHFVFFVIGVVVTLFFSWLQRKRKTLDWDLLADQPIVGAGTEYIGSSLTVAWEGTQLEHPRVINLRIFNSGNEELLGSQLEQHPISITIPSTKIIAAYVLESTTGAYPVGQVPVDHNADGDVVKLKPAFATEFLNRGKYVTVQVIVDGEEGLVDVASEFPGQSRGMRNVAGRQLSPLARWTLVVSYVSVVTALVIILLAHPTRQATGGLSIVFWITMALIVVGISTFFMSFYSHIRFLQRRYSLTISRAVAVALSPRQFPWQPQGRIKPSDK
jgi:hypothetical protein